MHLAMICSCQADTEEVARNDCMVVHFTDQRPVMSPAAYTRLGFATQLDTVMFIRHAAGHKIELELEH